MYKVRSKSIKLFEFFSEAILFFLSFSANCRYPAGKFFSKTSCILSQQSFDCSYMP